MRRHTEPKPLTSKRREVLAFILEYQRDNGGVAPTVEQIAHAIRTFKSAAYSRLKTLERDGWIRLTGEPNGIVVLHRPEPSVDETIDVELAGVIAAGAPIEAVGSVRLVSMPRLLAPGPDQFYLRVSGTSMVKAHILDGDLVLCRRQASVDPGQIAACLLADGTCTLKRVYKDKKSIRLQPAADGYEPIHVREITIQGKVIRIIRDVE